MTRGAAAFRVREAGAADLGAIERLIGAFQAEGDWRRDPPMHAATRAAIESGQATGARLFVAESTDAATSAGSSAPPHGVPGTPSGTARGPASPTSRATDAIGFASTWFAWDLGDGPGTWLSDLYVVPAWRRRGAGRALMSAAARVARADGAVWMAWHVDHANPVAQEFYVALWAERKPTHLVMSLGRAAIDRLGG